MLVEQSSLKSRCSLRCSSRLINPAAYRNAKVKTLGEFDLPKSMVAPLSTTTGCHTIDVVIAEPI
jgi:hypothetical protein